MFASTKLVAAFAAVAATVSTVCAAPAVFDPSKSKEDIVFRPDITAPAADATWVVGSVQTITWDTSSIPEEAKNQTGLILLGHIEEGSYNENLDIGHPLATNFPITAGAINVTVPDVEERKDYVVVLFGDSGNTSPKFTITQTEAETSSIFGVLSA